MKMMKRARNLIALALVAIGTCLMIYSAYFLLRYRSNTRDMEDNSKELLRELERVIPKDPVMTQDPVYKDASSMPAIEIKGISCIGILKVPKIGLELPVANNGSDIGFTPIHISGTPHTTDFVIEALGYSSQFGPLSELELKDNLIFVDLYGYQYSYEIIGIVSGTAEQLQAMDDAMLEETDSTESGLAAAIVEVEEQPAPEEEDTIQNLPGVETVTGNDNQNAKAETKVEQKAPELILKYRKSLMTYVRVAGRLRIETEEEQEEAAE
jgi:sortase (surface protein transpeptidase)